MKEISFISCRRKKIPSFKNLFKNVSFGRLDKIKDSLVVIDYYCLSRYPQFKADSYSNKIFLLYIDKNNRKPLKYINKWGFFDCIKEGDSYHEVLIKIQRANDFINLKKENKKLKEYIDSLRIKDIQLNCFNWQYFVENITSFIKETEGKNSSLSLIIFDIDYFRQINETYGWEFANYIIKKVVNIVRSVVSPRDRIIRYREDSFVVLFPFCSLEKAKKIAEKIKRRIRQCEFKYKNLSTHVGISLGIVNTEEDKLHNYREIIIALEEALRNSKLEGGNRLTLYRDLLKKTKVSPEKITDVESLRKRIRYLNREVSQNLLDTVYGFAKAIEIQDLSTAHHVEYVARVAKKIAKELGLSPQQIKDVYHAAILHDLGKIGISPKILLKKGKLNKEEEEIIKTHPWIGAEILREIHALRGAIPAILYHHERWDGYGYPLGLKGEEIPLSARIVALADVYAALTSKRPYRKAFSKEKAIQIIKKGRGKNFDPQIVDIFLRMIKE